METLIRKAETKNIEEIITEAGAILKAGGLVAFPTETVYGLGADALREEASAKIYEAKGRPSDNPLIVHIADMDSLSRIAAAVPEEAVQLAGRFWPGPLTMILKKKETVPYGTTGGLDTVAVRMPRHELALSLIRHGGGFVAAPSANTSGRPSPTKAEHVIEDMQGKIDMIVDGGAVGIGIESTIIDLSGEIPMILRPGFITKEMLEEVIGTVEEDRTLHSQSEEAGVPKAPGMKYKHYAPKGELIVVEGEMPKVINKINGSAAEGIRAGRKIGIIGTEETVGKYHNGIVRSIGSREDEASIAQHLYSLLREFDDLEAEIIYSESFETPKMGQAIMNRLLKAAGYHRIKV